jgi:hypothetical protein
MVGNKEMNNKAKLEIDFTDLEISLIIEGLIHLRELGKRPDFAKIAECDIHTYESMEDVPQRDITEKEDDAMAGLMEVFMEGLMAIRAEAEEEFFAPVSKQLISEIEEFLNPSS